MNFFKKLFNRCDHKWILIVEEATPYIQSIKAANGRNHNYTSKLRKICNKCYKSEILIENTPYDTKDLYNIKQQLEESHEKTEN